MRRSEINRILRESERFIREQNFRLPPFAWWTPDEWREKGREYDEIRDNLLGWDITDFGSGDFSRTGLVLFTIRNGSYSRPEYAKPYAEKILIADENQVTPYHFHWNKMEDIINRGGGVLLVRVYGSTPSGALDPGPVRVSTDGRSDEVSAGTVIRLSPGESITLPAGQYHTFRGEPGGGRVLIGEVSKVNDDRTDNRFLEPAGRFPSIEEDEPPLYLLCNEYPAAR